MMHDQPYLTAAGINLPAMRRGADAARWARYDGAGVQFIQIEEGWNVMHNAFNRRVRKESPGTDFGHRPDASTATLAWESFSRTARRRGFVGLRQRAR